MRISLRAHSASLIVAAASTFIATSAFAEPGDYSFFQTLRNLVSPPPADNKVTAAQRQGAFPLKTNPADFDDGFSRGRYLAWQTVQLHPATGAVCGNGSPYKIFVNRVAGTRNTLFYLEGGGACWDYETCAGRVPGQGYRNSGGIADDYMTINQLTTPFIFRLSPTDRVKTQDWNLVYVPYCTGDIYTGDRVATYTNPQNVAESVTIHHNGLRNVRAAVAWAKENLPRPTQMVVTGCSAGGVGTITNYHHMRRDVAPDRGFMINDSGAIVPAPTDQSTALYPSIPLHRLIRNSWNLDNGMLSIYRAELPGFQNENMGTLNSSLAARWPADRFGHVHFWDDLVYSRYSYTRFYDDVRNAPDQATREARQLDRWRIDTANLRNQLAGINNYGGYFPRFRDLTESHCATIVHFDNADIQEANLELRDFVSSILDGTGKVLDASESDTQADRNKPFNLFYWLIKNGEDILSSIGNFFTGLFR